MVPLAFFSLELADSAVVALNHHFAGEDVGVELEWFNCHYVKTYTRVPRCPHRVIRPHQLLAGKSKQAYPNLRPGALDWQPTNSSAIATTSSVARTVLSHHQKVFARFCLTLLGIWLNRPPKARAGCEGIVTFAASGIRLFMGLVKRLVMSGIQHNLIGFDRTVEKLHRGSRTFLCYAKNQGHCDRLVSRTQNGPGVIRGAHHVAK